MRFSFGVLLACGLLAQTPPANQAETSIKEEPATFKARVNLVMVPVVVRDRQGRTIGTLKQDDFQLFDKGKPQLISRFSVETATAVGAKAAGKSVQPGVDPATAMPERFVAYLFDDIHLRFEDLARVRDAAWEHMRNSLRPADRAAIFSTSGQTEVEFIDDREKLRGTLFTLRPRPIGRISNFQECPEVPYYQADLIVNKNDSMALAAATSDTMVCAHLDPTMRSAAESMARAAASQALAAGGQETRVSLGVLRDVIRHMAATPGQRTILLASPGFITPEDHQEKNDIIDRAIRANVTINSLDARGLWVDPNIDVGRQRLGTPYLREAVMADSDVLAELSYGTGGKFFQNNNDLAAGFRELAEIPEHMYLLGFSPQNLKLDGSYHALKVTLRSPAALAAAARRGYYAPRQILDAAEKAREEIREALFSREELREIPVDIQSQFFKPGNDVARLTVLARVDLKGLKYRKADERNRNDVTVVVGVFDRNGNWVTGVTKKVEMRLKDETLARPTMGVVVRSTVDVKPGLYLVRVVVRDDEGQQMAALNGAADIP